MKRLSIYKTTENHELLNPIAHTPENLYHIDAHLRQLKPKRLPNKALSREALLTLDTFSWLKKTETILFQPDLGETDDDALSNLYNQIKTEANLIVQNEVCLDNPKLAIGLDLETTGLNKVVKRQDGNNVIYNTIVGVCIAPTTNKGYYIPINHNQTDNSTNFSLQSVITLLQLMVDEFHIIYHNAVFDQEVMALNGVEFDNKRQSFSDTLLLTNLMGYKDKYFRLGLKNLSKEILKRPQLEIGDITQEKDINLQDYPASDIYVYGCCDAMNTLGLFHHIINHKENPYHFQKNRTILEHKVVSSVRSMFRFGLPVDYDLLVRTTKTIIRRSLILEDIFYDIISNKDISISSAEQCGTHIFTLIKKAFEKKHNIDTPLTPQDKPFKILTQQLVSINVKVKATQLKDRLKVSANLDSNAIYSLMSELDNYFSYIDPTIKNEIYTICEVLDNYRSLKQRQNILVAMMLDCFNDDIKISRVPIALKLSGADTGRFSNSGSKTGAFDKAQVVRMKTKTKVEITKGGGSASFNAQGLSHDTGKWRQFKRVKNIDELDPLIKKANDQIKGMVDAELYDIITGNK